MAPMLGKRKRRDKILLSHKDDVSTRTNTSVSDVQALLRQHFEASYEPLESSEAPVTEFESCEAETLGSQLESSSDWEGFEEEQDEAPAVVVHDSNWTTSKFKAPADELKTFMVRLSQMMCLKLSD